MRLILMGPPGAGKSTQARRLQERYGLAHISSGDLLRAEQAHGTAMGEQVASINEGHLAPDAIVRQLVDEQLNKHHSFVLDGVPRTLEFADWLHERLPLSQIDAIILLNVNLRSLRRRIAVRYATEQRPEDAPNHFIRRFEIYCQRTRQVTECYRRLDRLVEIDGDHSINRVEGRINHRLASVQTVRPNRRLKEWEGVQPCA